MCVCACVHAGKGKCIFAHMREIDGERERERERERRRERERKIERVFFRYHFPRGTDYIDYEDSQQSSSGKNKVSCCGLLRFSLLFKHCQSNLLACVSALLFMHACTCLSCR